MADCLPNTDERLDCLSIKAGETFPVTLSFFAMCAAYWTPNERFELGEFAWPTTPCGFVLECTRAGWSGKREPRWNQSLVDDTVEDGSAQFTLRVPDLSNGLQPITDVQVEAPAGITVSQPVVNENTKVFVDYMSSNTDESYDVVFTVTIAGRPRKASQTVHVVP